MAETPEQEHPILEGPDFRNLEAEAPEIWNMLLDIEAIDRVLAVMRGQATSGSVSYAVARQFVEYLAGEHRVRLAELIVKTYGVPMAETSPFGNAGKPRAFGAESPGPPGNV